MAVSRIGRWMAGIFGIVLISGCAGQRTAQTINRLQASVDLLDQRVTQLERTSLSPSASTTANETVTLEPVTVSPEVVSVKPSKASAASPKPTTKEIQQALRNAGFYQGAMDGRMGPMTREAVRQFQSVHGLKADGVVGKQTWQTLAPYQDLSSKSEGGQLSAAEPLK